MSLTVVLAGRNDLYGGGDYLRRMNQCLDSIVPLGCKIIFVEWNPPDDRPTLIHEIKHHGIHLITVAHDVHNWQHGAALMPMFEYRAKNVGIRKAKGEWILVMNSDIELSPEMRERLQYEFDPHCIYGAKRHDIRNGETVQVVNGPGDFVLMTRRNWLELTGYLDLVTYTHIDSLLWWNADDFGIERRILDQPIYHEEHDRTEQQVRWGIHSSDMPRFIGQRNYDKWGLHEVSLSETMT